MIVEDFPAFATLEPPWRDNEKNRSCIPAGRYTCQRVHSPRFGNTFEVTNVIDRAGILFHAGNIGADTEGCILLGLRFGMIDGEHAVKDSQKALKLFHERFKQDDNFLIRIIDAIRV